MTCNKKQYVSILFLVTASLLYASCNSLNEKKVSRRFTDWKEYYGDGGRSHYSSLDQITRENVSQLKAVWTYASGGADTVGNRTQIQCNPIIVNGILYGVSPQTQVFALDAENGKELWHTRITDNGGTTSRGVTYFEDSVDDRIFFGAGKWLYAFNAKTGETINSFGGGGRIDLREGLVRPGGDDYVVANTPNTIFTTHQPPRK